MLKCSHITEIKSLYHNVLTTLQVGIFLEINKEKELQNN